MKKSIFLAVSIILMAATAALAMERFDIVTTEQMKQLLDDRTAGRTDFVLVNSLDEIIFRTASIPGSVNVPWYCAEKVGDRIGDPKDRLVITY